MANVRDFLYKLRIKNIITSSRPDREIESPVTDQRLSKGPGSQNRLEDGGQSVEREADLDLQENPHPERKTISRMPTKWERRIKALVRFSRSSFDYLIELGYQVWELRWWREKTPQELEEEAEIRRRKKEAATYRKEADLYSRRISNAYARMGFCYLPNKNGYVFPGPKRVRFSHAVGEPNAIHLKIAHPLPYGVDILKLVNDEAVLSNIAASCRHAVQASFSAESGAWLMIERGRGTRGVPNQVSYSRMMKLMPEERDNLTVPFGEAANSKRIYKSFRPFPHMLIGGATGNGKTNYLNMILCSLVETNSPEDLQLVLVDLKNGIEFDLYEGLPHLWSGFDQAPNGIIGRNDQVIPLLKALKKEGERRLNLFKSRKINRIEDYNKSRQKGKMPRLFFVIDEWARISQSTDGKQADQLLAEITATYRAAGFHVIVCTQMPKVKVVSTLIKTNLSARLAFGVPSNVESMVILDNTQAQGLQPPGRAIFKFGMTNVEVQTPLVERSTVKRIVAKAIETGGNVKDTNALSMEEIFKYSLEYLEGSLAYRMIYDHFQDRISQHELRDWLQDYEDQVVNIENQQYKIIPARGGPYSRRIEKYGPMGGAVSK
jgi:hypothetical protein